MSTQFSRLRCPACTAELSFSPIGEGPAAARGTLACEACTSDYEVRHGLPNLVYPAAEALPEMDRAFLSQYERVARSYDRTLRLLMLCFGMWEPRARRRALIDPLELSPSDSVLEVGVGTGSNLPLIAARVGPRSTIHAMDLSPGMLAVARAKAARRKLNVEFALANAAHLPYPDSVFDAVLHFGGINTFGDKEGAIAEMVRVAKPGARVVIGDEGLAPGREHTRVGKWVVKHNKLFSNKPPEELFPAAAGTVQVNWTWRGLFYVLRVTIPTDDR